MKLLVVNPNTSGAITELLREHTTRAAGPDVQILTATATLGADYIASEASYALAAHGLLDAWARHVAAHGEPDGVLVGCFGDPGLPALRELSTAPALGLAEAAMRLAAERGPFTIVTGGAAWGPMLMRLTRELRLDGLLTGIHTVAPSGAELAADPASAIRTLHEACRRAASAQGASGSAARSVILGGAGLAGMAGPIAALGGGLPPLIDSVEAGVAMLLRRVAEGGRAPVLASSAPGWMGLSPPLAQRLSRTR